MSVAASSKSGLIERGSDHRALDVARQPKHCGLQKLRTCARGEFLHKQRGSCERQRQVRAIPGAESDSVSRRSDRETSLSFRGAGEIECAWLRNTRRAARTVDGEQAYVTGLDPAREFQRSSNVAIARSRQDVIDIEVSERRGQEASVEARRQHYHQAAPRILDQIGICKELQEHSVIREQHESRRV